jgi:two-component system, chemotaxis family, sensor kinase Cph1
LVNPGDHICALYADDRQLAEIVGPFLAERRRRGERCWCLPAGNEEALIGRALEREGVRVAQETKRGALAILSSNAAYDVRGDFDPEETMRVFSDAIEQVLTDGFSGFRAAANMSWALNLTNGPERLIEYEALLRSLFSTARATGLCLYDRNRMPLAVIDGALATHPLIRTDKAFKPNPFYDAGVRAVPTSNPAAVHSKLMQLDPAGGGR